MNVKEIVEKYLKDSGHDGLYAGCCGCKVDDLCPCGEIYMDCMAGYCNPEQDDPNVWYIGPEKEQNND